MECLVRDRMTNADGRDGIDCDAAASKHGGAVARLPAQGAGKGDRIDTSAQRSPGDRPQPSQRCVEVAVLDSSA